MAGCRADAVAKDKPVLFSKITHGGAWTAYKTRTVESIMTDHLHGSLCVSLNREIEHRMVAVYDFP